MTTQRSRTLTLELVQAGPDSITGRLCDSDGTATEFVGWLGLAGAIETLSPPPRPRALNAY